MVSFRFSAIRDIAEVSGPAHGAVAMSYSCHGCPGKGFCNMGIFRGGARADRYQWSG